MTIEEALEMQWLPLARSIFPQDWAFHPQLAATLYRLQKGDLPNGVIDLLEEVPFDEWEQFLRYAIYHHIDEAIDFLWFIARLYCPP